MYWLRAAQEATARDCIFVAGIDGALLSVEKSGE
jgi:hypothetical protein